MSPSRRPIVGTVAEFFQCLMILSYLQLQTLSCIGRDIPSREEGIMLVAPEPLGWPGPRLESGRCATSDPPTHRASIRGQRQPLARCAQHGPARGQAGLFSHRSRLHRNTSPLAGEVGRRPGEGRVELGAAFVEMMFDFRPAIDRHRHPAASSARTTSTRPELRHGRYAEGEILQINQPYLIVRSICFGT
jgi:hypothetical protein